MEDQQLNLLEGLKTSVNSWNIAESQPVPETKIREIVREEIDVRISNLA